MVIARGTILLHTRPKLDGSDVWLHVFFLFAVGI